MSAEASLSHKLNKKVKLTVGRSKSTKDGTRKAKSILNSVKRYGRENGEKENSKWSTKNKRTLRGEVSEEDVDMEESFKPKNENVRRKRIYSNRDSHLEVTRVDHASTLSRNAASGKGKSWKGVTNSRSSRPVRISRSSKDASIESKGFSRKIKSEVKSAQLSNEKRRTREIEVQDNKYAKFDGDRNSSLKRPSKRKNVLSKSLYPSEKKSLNLSPSSLAKKKFRDKKSGHDNYELQDDQPKKKKRVIRIDPNDSSNKRLDDGVMNDEITKEKKLDLEKNAEMSKNAQFRAIQPSPSVLSFVEDNLLGRRRMIELRRAGYNIDLSAPLDNIPFSTGTERERIEENIFRNRLAFYAAAKVSSSFPPPELPEIAFAGRSNVGKSSLLNALTRQWGVVRTSDKPGLTQTINFFKLGTKLNMVDLPGYGFAYAKEEVKEAWEDLVKEYVTTRVGLKRVCLLIDTKWGMKPRDRELIDLMERSETKYQIVLTKTDLVFPIDVARRAMQIEENLKAQKSVVQPVMMVSSNTGAGIRSLRTVLAKIARFAKV